MQIESLSIPARDGFMLGATGYQPDANPTHTTISIHSATAVPQRFYRHLATFLVSRGYFVLTYDYRGIGASRPASLRGFEARASDWTLQDMAGAIDWVQATCQPRRHFVFGHSYGGQTVGLLPNADQIDAMVTLSSQSGYWRLQGGLQKVVVAFHVHLTLPLLAHLFGYMPWSWIGSAEDLPKGFALEWSRWCRQPGYLLDDEQLPLHRYRRFQAPVLAFSFDDDSWGTRRSVDAMMGVYPHVTRRHVRPADVGLPRIGHFGYFRAGAEGLWQEALDWLEGVSPPAQEGTYSPTEPFAEASAQSNRGHRNFELRN
jgi:predicted alpha/beta hydrolase